MAQTTGSFFDKDAVIYACEIRLREYEDERREDIQEYCDNHRYKRCFPKFWLKEALTNEQILARIKESNDICTHIKYYRLVSEFRSEPSVKSLLKLARKSDGRVYITRKDFESISRHMP